MNEKQEGHSNPLYGRKENEIEIEAPNLSQDQFDLARLLWRILHDEEYHRINPQEIADQLGWDASKVATMINNSLFARGVVDRMIGTRDTVVKYDGLSEYLYRRGPNRRVFVLKNPRSPRGEKELIDLDAREYN